MPIINKLVISSEFFDSTDAAYLEADLKNINSFRHSPKILQRTRPKSFGLKVTLWSEIVVSKALRGTA